MLEFIEHRCDTPSPRSRSRHPQPGPRFEHVAIMTLCSGPHDEDGLDLLTLFCEYLDQECKSGMNFEACNAYLSRFFHIHGRLIGNFGNLEVSEDGIEGGRDKAKEGETRERKVKRMFRLLDIVKKLTASQERSSALLKGKLQYSLSVLRNFIQF